MARQKKFVDHHGDTFVGTLSRGKVTVRKERTAPGQNMISGILDVESGSWQNGSRKASLPSAIKAEVEKEFL